MIKLYSLLLSVLLTSCFTPAHNYLGNSYTPTKDVDVYVDASAIKRAYSVMGRAMLTSEDLYPWKKFSELLLKQQNKKVLTLFCSVIYLYRKALRFKQ